jgi:KipI family sensor histidine kinase inhibitor
VPMDAERPFADVVAAGECCLTVVLGSAISEDTNARVHTMRASLNEQHIPGVLELVPGYCTLAIYIDPLKADVQGLCTLLLREGRMTRSSMRVPQRTVVFPVLYGDTTGPDLGRVAASSGLSVDDVIARHAGRTYTCAMLGFLPGFPYLLGLDSQLETPRLDAPRVSVPAGSVGIAGCQTGIYPLNSPGGWNIIGRTPLHLFDAETTIPTLVRPGDRVEFRSIGREEYDRRSTVLSAVCPQKADSSSLGVTTPAMRVEATGLLTTVQDLGRPGYQDIGMPLSGAMDPQALAIGNILVGNDPDAAALEMTITGPVLRFETDALVAVTGADLHMTVNDRDAPAWTCCSVCAGDSVSFRGADPSGGCRAYLCVAGGIRVPRVMGSRSTLLRSRTGGLEGRALKVGDAVPIALLEEASLSLLGFSCPENLREEKTGCDALPILPGPQRHVLDSTAISTLTAATWVVAAASDRMGYRLEGPALSLAESADIISAPVPLGAVQVTGSGQPIVLLADHQTTGGYAVPFVVARAWLASLAQRQPGDTVTFTLGSVASAVEGLRRQGTALKQLAELRREWLARLNTRQGDG